jgi:hypothetical protein
VLFTIVVSLLVPGLAAAQVRGTLRQQTTGQTGCQASNSSQTSGMSTLTTTPSSTSLQATNALSSQSFQPTNATLAALQQRQQILAQLQSLNQQPGFFARSSSAVPRFSRR